MKKLTAAALVNIRAKVTKKRAAKKGLVFAGREATGDYALTIKGRPIPKKNSLAFRKMRNGGTALLQAPAHQQWEYAAVLQLQQQWRGMATITKPVRLSCVFYEHPQQRFDLAGVFQSVCDALQAAGIYANDRQVRQSGGMGIVRDRDNPRVELTLTILEELDA